MTSRFYAPSVFIVRGGYEDQWHFSLIARLIRDISSKGGLPGFALAVENSIERSSRCLLLWCAHAQNSEEVRLKVAEARTAGLPIVAALGLGLRFHHRGSWGSFCP